MSTLNCTYPFDLEDPLFSGCQIEWFLIAEIPFVICLHNTRKVVRGSRTFGDLYCHASHHCQHPIVQYTPTQGAGRPPSEIQSDESRVSSHVRLRHTCAKFPISELLQSDMGKALACYLTAVAGDRKAGRFSQKLISNPLFEVPTIKPQLPYCLPLACNCDGVVKITLTNGNYLF